MAKTIMIVDDEADIRDSFKIVLSKRGYKIITAKDADDCLRKLKTNKPDLILMDIMMPGTPVRKIMPKIKKVKVSYLSVVQLTDAEKEGLLKQKNVVDFINKPIQIEDLVKRVKKILGE